MLSQLGGGQKIAHLKMYSALARELGRIGVHDFSLIDGPKSGNFGIKVVECESRKLVVKRFGVLTHDARTRWLRETNFLTWANARDVQKFVPTLISHSRRNGLVIEEFIEGAMIGQPTIGNYQIAAEFFIELVKAGYKTNESVPLAKEHLGSARALRDQIARRRRLISKLSSKVRHNPAMASIVGVLTSYSDSQVASDCLETVDFADEFSEVIGACWIVSPSDLGFHNFIQTHGDGRGKFIDFEYGGIDRPLKAFMDFILQPEHPIERQDLKTFTNFLGLPDNFLGSIPSATLRVFAIKWAAIVAARALLDGQSSEPKYSGYPHRLERYVEIFRGGFE